MKILYVIIIINNLRIYLNKSFPIMFILKLRIKFFGLNIINIEPGSKKDLDFPDRICNNSCYKSSLSLFSEGKLYPCKAALDLNKETSTTQTIIDSSKFNQESKYFKIYNHAT